MEITIPEKRNGKGIDDLCRTVAEIAVALMITTGMLLSLCSVMRIQWSGAAVLLWAAAGTAGYMLAARRKHGIPAMAILATAAGSVCFLTWDRLVNGMLVFANAVCDAVGNRFAVAPSGYALLSEETASGDLQIFMAVITTLCSFLTCVMFRKCRTAASALWFVTGIFAICCDGNTDTAAKVLFAGGVICAVLYSGQHMDGRRGKRRDDNGGRLTLLCFLLTAVTAGAALWAAALVIPPDEYRQPELLQDVGETARDAVETMRYGRADVNTLPKGDLKKAETWEGSEETALKVTFENPQSLYLRGFVGSVYDSDEWRDLDRSVYYENRDLFYWLHEYGFSADTQLAGLRRLLTDTSLNDRTGFVEVTNVAADREFMYTPYEVVTPDGSAGENDGDTYQRSSGFFGTKEYAFESFGNLVKDFPQMAAEGYLYAAEADNDSYASAESHYNVFVYEHYTEIPSSLAALFEEKLGYAGEEGEHVNYYSAITKIRTCLESTMTYGNYAEDLPDGEDFVAYFLTKSGIGNPVHYASTAALMFRYYGIPSRYVEGYVITPEDIEALSGKSTVEIAGTGGHAWVEIYVDGLGWIPVEMTPEYYDLMEQPDMTIGLEPDSTVVVRETEEEPEEESSHEAAALKKKLVMTLIDFAKLLFIALILFDLFCILFFIYSLVRRRMANAGRKKAFCHADHGAAVRSMTGYMAEIMELAGEIFTSEEKERYAEAYRIGEKAAFSLHHITGQERSHVAACKDMLIGKLKEKKGWYEKWVLKYIVRLY